MLPLARALPSFMALRAAANCAAVVLLLPPLVVALPACAVAQVVRVRERIISMVTRKRVFIGRLLVVMIADTAEPRTEARKIFTTNPTNKYHLLLCSFIFSILFIGKNCFIYIITFLLYSGHLYFNSSAT